MADHLDTSANADMSESDGVRRHLPECEQTGYTFDWRDCICDRLRQAEQRVREEYGSLRTMEACADRARANGHREAREAVAALLPDTRLTLKRSEVLAAIDALRGESDGH